MLKTKRCFNFFSCELIDRWKRFGDWQNSTPNKSSDKGQSPSPQSKAPIKAHVWAADNARNSKFDHRKLRTTNFATHKHQGVFIIIWKKHKHLTPQNQLSMKTKKISLKLAEEFTPEIVGDWGLPLPSSLADGCVEAPHSTIRLHFSIFQAHHQGCSKSYHTTPCRELTQQTFHATKLFHHEDVEKRPEEWTRRLFSVSTSEAGSLAMNSSDFFVCCFCVG